MSLSAFVPVLMEEEDKTTGVAATSQEAMTESTQPLSPKYNGGLDEVFQPETADMISGQPESPLPQSDTRNQNDIQPQMSSHSAWASEAMSLPQEVLFVATICFTMFCNRESLPGGGIWT